MRYIAGTRARTQARRGAVLPLVAICLIALMGMLALAIDIGVVAVARSQAQNAADAAAMAAARTITGSTGQNYNEISVNAVMAASANTILGQSISGDSTKIANPSSDLFSSGQVSVQCGGFSYVYDDSNPSAEGFKLTLPGVPSGEPYSAAQVTVQTTSPTSFGRVFGLNSFNVQATSAAVHRPRDVVIIMDMSGSMRFQSLAGVYVDSSGTSWPNYPTFGRNTSLNADPIFPQFGHYSDTASAALQGSGTSYTTSTGVDVDPSNISAASDAGSAIAADFTSSGSTPAFTPASTSYAGTPGGDDFPKAGGNYVATAQAYLTASGIDPVAFGTNGYGANFNGYTQGPNYWGKTFFMWPPDPRGSALDANNTANHANNGAKDWRQRFFFKKNVATGLLGWLDHNNILFNPNGRPMTGANFVTPIINTPQTQTTVTEGGVNTKYTYCINYLAILNWLQANPSIFPSQMTTGRITYYSAMPDTTDTTLNSRWWTTYPLTDINERFWKDYIDFVLGLRGNGAGTYINNNGAAGGGTVPLSAVIGNGDYYQWGAAATKITQKPNVYTATANNVGGYAKAYAGPIAYNNMSGGYTPAVGDYVWFNNTSPAYQIQAVGGGTFTLSSNLAAAINNGDALSVCYTACAYMDPNDNPYRPRHQFWFGAMTFADWLGNYSTNTFMWPGNVHEAQAWACKAGVQTAINDIQNNHPNDYVGMLYFSTPRYSSADTVGRQNAPVVGLGRSYSQLTGALWFPPSTVTGGASTITPYDTDFPNVPRAYGGTTPVMTFMMAYNMLSSSVSKLRTYAQPQATYYGNAGGLGRKGATRMVIFETDGAPNAEAYTPIVANGSDSYYPIRVVDPADLTNSGNEFPTSGAWAWANGTQNVYTVVQQICAQTSASPPGFSTTAKPAQVYCIGYGSLFDPANGSATQTSALTFLQTIQYSGNTSKDTTPSNFPTAQLIYGTPTQRINSMQTAFTSIMQSGVQVSIIQ